MFIDSHSHKGFEMYKGPLRRGDNFRKRVVPSDEAFVWGVIDNYVEGGDKNMWGGEDWIEKFNRWGQYVVKCRDDDEYTKIEKEALEVRKV